MSQHEACQTLTVGQSEYCSITKCPDCRTYHLHIGPLSLRLREEVFESICGALSSVYRGALRTQGGDEYEYAQPLTVAPCRLF